MPRQREMSYALELEPRMRSVNVRITGRLVRHEAWEVPPAGGEKRVER